MPWRNREHTSFGVTQLSDRRNADVENAVLLEDLLPDTVHFQAGPSHLFRIPKGYHRGPSNPFHFLEDFGGDSGFSAGDRHACIVPRPTGPSRLGCSLGAVP